MKLIKFAPKKKLAQAMVEFAIVLPILLLLLYGLLEAGRLLFMYSTIVTASRQAVRYGTATGIGTGSAVARYRDCLGIRQAANKADYLNAFNDTTSDIQIWHDEGPNDPLGPQAICAPGVAAAPDWGPTNKSRLLVKVTGHFNMIVKLVPQFATRTIETTSARSLLVSVSIDVTPPGSAGTVPTTTSVSTSPNPSQPGQPVTISFTVSPTSGTVTPTGTVDVKADGVLLSTCTAVSLDPSGIGSCTYSFPTINPNINIEAVYTPDTTSFAGSTGTATHQVGKSGTTTEIIHDDPDYSQPGESVHIVVQVTNIYSGSMPTGDVNIDVCGPRTLNSGVAFCDVPFPSEGWITIHADYLGDAEHETSNDPDGELHQVLGGTATATNTPPPTNTLPPTSTATITPIPTATVPATATSTPTIVPTSVTGCDSTHITTSSLQLSGNTLRMSITNTNSYALGVKTVFVVWNDDKGHHLGTTDTTLKLQQVELPAGNIFWSIDPPWQGGPSFEIIPSATVNIPGNGATSWIIFTFHQSYTKRDNTEEIYITFSTPGCENFFIDQTKW